MSNYFSNFHFSCIPILLYSRIILKGIKYSRIDGTITESADRQKIVNQFNSDTSLKVMLLTTGVGGVGLTITG